MIAIEFLYCWDGLDRSDVTFEEVHIWLIMGFLFFLVVWALPRLGPIGLLIGVLTYVPLAGVDYKVINAGHVVFLYHLGITKQV